MLLGHGGTTAFYSHLNFNICFSMQFAQHTIRTLELGHTIFALSCSCSTSAEPISELQLLGCIVSMVSGRILRLLVPLTLICVLS